MGTSLLQRGIAIEKKDNLGWPILFHACQSDRTDLVKSLLKMSTNVKHKASDGKTALMIAAEQGNTKVADALMKKGCKLNTQNIDGNTAFMLALLAKQVQFAQHLMEKYTGLDVNARNVENQDALGICSHPALYNIKVKLLTMTKDMEEISIKEQYALKAAQ